jgi:site-specific DNA-methyltransferase (adenine-specific)
MGLMKLLATKRQERLMSGHSQLLKNITTGSGIRQRQFLLRFDGWNVMKGFPIKPNGDIPQFSFQLGISRNCRCDGPGGMPDISPGTVDLVLTDPPYAIAKGQRLTKVGNVIQTEMTKYQHYDEFAEGEFQRNMISWIREFNRILRPGGNLVIFCGKEWIWLIQVLAETFKLEFKDMIIAEKLAPQPALAQKTLRSCFETSLWFYKPPLSAVSFNQQSQDVCKNLAVWNFLNFRQTKHPNEKPLPLMRWAVETFSNKGDLVVDAFGGSGSTGEACLQSGRQCILFEMNPEYWAEEKDRLANMLPMFGGSETPSLPGFDSPGTHEIPDPESTDTDDWGLSEPPSLPSTPLQKVDETAIDW